MFKFTNTARNSGHVLIASLALAGAALIAVGSASTWSAHAADSKDAKKPESSGGWFSKSSSEPAAKPATAAAPARVLPT